MQDQLHNDGVAAAICFGAHRDYAPADIRYLARWSCTDEELSFVFVPAEGETALVTDAAWDVERARSEASVGEVVFDREPARALTRLVTAHAGSASRVGIAGFAVFPAPIYLALRDALPGVSFIDVSTEVDRPAPGEVTGGGRSAARCRACDGHRDAGGGGRDP